MYISGVITIYLRIDDIRVLFCSNRLRPAEDIRLLCLYSHITRFSNTLPPNKSQHPPKTTPPLQSEVGTYMSEKLKVNVDVDVDVESSAIDDVYVEVESQRFKRKMPPTRKKKMKPVTAKFVPIYKIAAADSEFLKSVVKACILLKKYNVFEVSDSEERAGATNMLTNEC